MRKFNFQDSENKKTQPINELRQTKSKLVL